MTSAIPIHGGNVNAEAQRLGVKENQLLDASASLVPFPPPKKLQRYLQKALVNGSLRNYPDSKYQTLRNAIGMFHGVDPSMVLPGNGAAELLTWSARNAADKGVSTLVAPGFSDYERALKCWKGEYMYMHLPLNWSCVTPQNFPPPPKSNVIWITNPHNPTGQLWSRASIENLVKDFDLVICDEAFLSLVPNGESQSVIPLVSNNENLIVIRSLTKLFAIAGLRLGYAISSEKRLEEWQDWRDPWPINGIASATGTILMNDKVLLKKWTKKIHSWIQKEGPWMKAKLARVSEIKAHPSSTNFHLIESKQSLTKLQNELNKRNILVRDCRSFNGLGENWLRISLQTRRNNLLIASAIQEILR